MNAGGRAAESAAVSASRNSRVTRLGSIRVPIAVVNTKPRSCHSSPAANFALSCSIRCARVISPQQPVARSSVGSVSISAQPIAATS